MSSTALSNSTGVPDIVTRAFKALANGQLDLDEVQQILMIALQENQGRMEAMHELLDDELGAERLSIAQYGELISALGSIASENVPTECSDEGPDESGVYRVMNAGEMVRARTPRSDDTGAFERVAVAAGAGVPDDSEGTKPLSEKQQADMPSPAPTEVRVGDVLRDRFRLEEEVARGNMGVVYRATDLMKLQAEAADPRVAVKVVSPAIANNALALRAFQSEVAGTQHLSHPHIVHLFDLDRDGDNFFITMEWLDGQSLAALLDRHTDKPPPESISRPVVEQLCAALSYAHEHGVVHADVKPGNVFLTASGETKLIDFGIATSGAALARTESPVGITPVYASCERLEGAAPTERDDLFSLACVVYRLMTGRRVFGTLTALEAETRGMEPAPVPALGDAAWRALRRALAFRAADRHAGVAEFARDFFQAGSAAPEDPHTQSMPPELADVFDDAVASQTGLHPELRTPQPSGADSDPLAESVAEPLSESAPAPELEPLDIEWELPAAAAESAASSRQPQPRAGKSPPEPAVAAPAEASPVDVELAQPADELFADDDNGSPLARYRWVAVATVLAVTIGALTWFGPDDAAPVRPASEADTRPAPQAAKPDRLGAAASAVPVEPALARVPEGDAAPAATPDKGVLPEGALPAEAEAFANAQPAAPSAAADNPPPAAPPEPSSPVTATETAAAESAAPPPGTTGSPAVAEVTDTTAAPVVPQEAPATPTAAVVPAQPDVAASEPTQAEMLGSLEIAVRDALAAERLEAPARDNAVYYLDKMRAIDASDPVTRETTAEVAKAFLAQAEQALTAGDPEATLYALDIAAQFDAPQAQADPLREQAQARLAESAAAAAAQAAAEAAAREAAVVPSFDPDEPIALSELEFVEFVEPRYPRNLNIDYTGWVDLQFRVDAAGRTSEIVVVGMDLPDRFAQPSIDAVGNWRFEPYVVDGEAVAVLSAVRLRFEK